MRRDKEVGSRNSEVGRGKKGKWEGGKERRWEGEKVRRWEKAGLRVPEFGWLKVEGERSKVKG